MSPEIIDALEVGDELFTTFEVQDDKYPVVITKVYKSYGKVHGIQIEYTGFCGKCGCANGMYHKKLYIPRDELLHRLEDMGDPTIPDHYYYRDVCVMREGCALPDVLKRREKEKEKMQQRQARCINIPEGATNGDALISLYPDLKYTIQNGRVVTTIGVASSFDIDWWNAPYKAGK